jgi:charged multivesicular body protein 5
MNRVFGKKRAPGPPPPSLTEASTGVGNQMDSLDAKISQLDKELKSYREKLKSTTNAAAKASLQKRAMDVLKRKKMYESQRDQLAGQQFNIDQAAFGIESAKSTVSTVAAMKAANVELKRTMKYDLKIEDVEDLADDMAELMDEFNEINVAMSTNFSTPNDIDEADLEAELDMLADELEEDALGETDAVPSYLQQSSTTMPPTPTAPLGARVPLASGGQKVDEYGLPV